MSLDVDIRNAVALVRRSGPDATRDLALALLGESEFKAVVLDYVRKNGLTVEGALDPTYGSQINVDHTPSGTTIWFAFDAYGLPTRVIVFIPNMIPVMPERGGLGYVSSFRPSTDPATVSIFVNPVPAGPRCACGNPARGDVPYCNDCLSNLPANGAG